MNLLQLLQADPEMTFAEVALHVVLIKKISLLLVCGRQFLVLVPALQHWCYARRMSASLVHKDSGQSCYVRFLKRCQDVLKEKEAPH